VAIDYITDWSSRLKSRLYEQFKYKPNFVAWAEMIARQVQDLEDATQALRTIISIDDSVGPQLDNLGRIIGQVRTGIDDATYRLYLRARIAANKSNGTAENIYRVFRALFGNIGFTIRQGGNKSFALTIRTPLTAAQVAVAVSFLRDSKEAGARANLEYTTVDDTGGPTDNILRWDVAGHGFDVSVWGNATQV
jgi:hypothetical protein